MHSISLGVTGAKPTLQDIAQAKISAVYYFGNKLNPDWLRNFKDEVKFHTHWLSFEYLVLDEEYFRKPNEGLIDELSEEAKSWLYLIGEK